MNLFRNCRELESGSVTSFSACFFVKVITRFARRSEVKVLGRNNVGIVARQNSTSDHVPLQVKTAFPRAISNVNCFAYALPIWEISFVAIAFRRPVAYPLDVAYHACYALGGNAVAIACQISHFIRAGRPASRRKPITPDFDDLTSMSIDMFANALAVHFWYHDKNKENDGCNPRAKEDGADITRSITL
jgi:hypothetical protein